jgi:hypothetical protein
LFFIWSRYRCFFAYPVAEYFLCAARHEQLIPIPKQLRWWRHVSDGVQSDNDEQIVSRIRQIISCEEKISQSWFFNFSNGFKCWETLPMCLWSRFSEVLLVYLSRLFHCLVAYDQDSSLLDLVLANTTFFQDFYGSRFFCYWEFLTWIQCDSIYI